MNARAVVRGFDALLSRWHGISDLESEPECIIRIALATAGDDISLSDGSEVRAGDAVLELHWASDRLPHMPLRGPVIAWAVHMRREIQMSLTAVARQLVADPALSAVVACRAEIAFGTRLGRAQMVRLARRFGFDVAAPTDGNVLAHQLYAAGDGLLLWVLVWAFNPGGLKHKTLRRERHTLWISRRALIARHGPFRLNS